MADNGGWPIESAVDGVDAAWIVIDMRFFWALKLLLRLFIIIIIIISLFCWCVGSALWLQRSRPRYPTPANQLVRPVAPLRQSTVRTQWRPEAREESIRASLVINLLVPTWRQREMADFPPPWARALHTLGPHSQSAGVDWSPAAKRLRPSELDLHCFAFHE